MNAKKTAADTTNKKTLLYFLLIRDEIGMLPRPNIPPQEMGDAEAIATVKSKKKRSETGAKQTSIQALEHAYGVIDLLITRLEAYEKAIKKIERITHNAMIIFDNVDVGGRKPNVEIQRKAKEMATDHRSGKGKFPSARSLNDMVCEQLFKADPQAYIDSVKHRMKEKDVALNRISPVWRYWKNCFRPCSQKSMHNILVTLREATGKNKFA